MDLKQRLSAVPVTALIRDHKLICVELQTTTGEALKVLGENHLLAVPVRDVESSTGCRGFVDVLDIVASLVELYKDKILDSEKFINRPVSDLIDKSQKDEWIAVEPTESILELLSRFAKGVHRVTVLAGDGSGKLQGVATQTDMLRYLLQDEELRAGFDAILSQSLQHLNLVKQWVLFVNKQDHAIKSYQKMDEHKVSAVAVLDQKTFVASISAADLRGIITPKEFKILNKPNMDFLAKQRSNLELLEICHPEDTLSSVCQKLLHHHFHRLWVTDNQLEPVGVVSLTDICFVVEAHLC